MMSGNTSNGTILEDDQQLYDWGIENRLDQYYQVNPDEGQESDNIVVKMTSVCLVGPIVLGAEICFVLVEIDMIQPLKYFLSRTRAM